MARAMGLNAISTYVFWNTHERSEGTYDFRGDNDVARFIRIAQEEDLAVILRPGPYVCAEWDFGGLPAWLLKDGDIPLRSTDVRFMRPVHRWLQRMGEELAPLQTAHGGPIVAVQLENEYGAFGCDCEYLRALRAALEDAGFGVSPLYTIDQPGDLARGALDGVPVAVTFAPGDPGTQFAQVRALRPNAALLCGEYWAGWFDHWGEPRALLDEEQQAMDLDWMLSRSVSVNVYMFHGGTNFGFWNGANAFEPHPYQPTTTSYDYQAALDEAGRPTRKYWRFREVISKYAGTPPPVPSPPDVTVIPEFTLEECAPLTENLGQAVASEHPLSMEALGQNFGFLLYRTALRSRGGTLTIEGLRDYAVIMVDGRAIAHLDRRLNESQVQLPFGENDARLDILVENCGRINYGPEFPYERKGIIGGVFLDGEALGPWKIYCLPLDTIDFKNWSSAACNGPALYRGTFEVTEPADVFLDTADMRKGVLWINGRNAGRFWHIGPQRSLYVPGVWLRSGRNEVRVLEMFSRRDFPRLRSV